MDKTIIEVLEKIEEAGFEAYIVGGFVRDLVRGFTSTDIDICTNARPIDLNEIFGNTGNSRNEEFGAYKIITGKYNFDITTYRKELKYVGRKPSEIEYVNNLLEDIKRRDFTINSLCMGKNGTIIDLLNAIDDIHNQKIKVIGDVSLKLTEDPLRILRALRFGITLDFNIDEQIINFIKENKHLLKDLSRTRIKYELECILVSSNVIKGLQLLKDLDLLNELNLKYDEIVYVEDILGIWAQIEVLTPGFFNKEEQRSINAIKKVLEYGSIDSIILFETDLYISTVAGTILGYDKTTVNELYNNLPIHNLKEIAINTGEIINILNIKPSNIIKTIYSNLKDVILNKELENDKNAIINYLLANKKRWV